MSYDIGDRRKLACTIRDEAGDLADPDELTFQIRVPDGTLTDYTYGTDPELVRDSEGVFHVYWDCDQSGVHRYRWQSTGALAAAEESRFRVRSTAFVTAAP